MYLAKDALLPASTHGGMAVSAEAEVPPNLFIEKGAYRHSTPLGDFSPTLKALASCTGRR